METCSSEKQINGKQTSESRCRLLEVNLHTCRFVNNWGPVRQRSLSQTGSHVGSWSPAVLSETVSCFCPAESCPEPPRSLILPQTSTPQSVLVADITGPRKETGTMENQAFNLFLFLFESGSCVFFLWGSLSLLPQVKMP